MRNLTLERLLARHLMAVDIETITRLPSDPGQYRFELVGQATPNESFTVSQVGVAIASWPVTSDLQGDWRLIVENVKLTASEFRFRAATVSNQADEITFQPNIILVNVDDMRWDDTGFLPFFTSEIAPEAVTFRNSFVPTALSGPSRASLLTGLYAHKTGILSNEAPYGGAINFDDNATLPVWLQELGYQTGLFGKDRTLPKSDDLSPLVDVTQAPPGWDDYFAAIAGGTLGFGTKLTDNGTRIDTGLVEEDYLTDLLAVQANEFIDNNPAGSKPFFAYIAPFAPHNPAIPAPRHGHLYDDLSLEQPPSFNVSEPSGVSLSPGLLDYLTTLRRNYAESLVSVDEMIESIFVNLQEENQLDNTVFVFTADNGFLFGEHGYYGKSRFYEESARVPLYLWDGRSSLASDAGSSEDAMVLNLDLAPTFVALAGGTVPQGIDGQSLLPILNGTSTAVREDFLMSNRPFSSGVMIPEFAVRNSQYTYGIRENGLEFLFDHQADPYQLTNLVNDPAHGIALAEMQQRLEELQPSDRTPPAVISAEIVPSATNVNSPQSLLIRTTITDANRGGSAIRTPELVFPNTDPNEFEYPFDPFDGKYNSVTEINQRDLDWDAWLRAGSPATVFIEARDLPGNWSTRFPVPLPLGPAPALAATSDTGAPNDRLTLDRMPTFVGSADPGEAVALFVAKKTIPYVPLQFTSFGSTVADGNGDWQITGTLNEAGEYIVFGQTNQASGFQFLAATSVHLLGFGTPSFVLEGTDSDDFITVTTTATGSVAASLNGVNVGQVNGITKVTIFGLDGSDTLQANGPLPTVLNGGSGDDLLVGGDGSDQLNGGGGNNLLRGGLGSDRYMFRDAGLQKLGFRLIDTDTVDDPSGPQDLIDLNQANPVTLSLKEGPSPLIASYSTIFSNTRKIESTSGTPKDKFSQLILGANDDVAVVNATMVVQGGRGDDSITIAQTLEVNQFITLKTFHLGLTATSGETVRTTLSALSGSLQVRSNLAGPTTVVGNDTSTIVLTGTATGIQNLLRLGVKVTAGSSFLGDLIVSQTSVITTDRLRSETDTHKLRVISIPKITGIATSSTYVENAVPTLVSSAAVFTDINANVQGGTLEILSNGFSEASDRLSISSNGTTIGRVNLSGANVQYSGITVGTLVANNPASTVLRIAFNSSATQAAVQAILRRVSFRIINENPQATARQLIYRFINADAQTSTTVSQSLAVVPVNDRPTLRSTTNVTYLQNANNFRPVGQSILVADPEQNYANGKLTVRLTAAMGATTNADVLQLVNQGSGANQVSIVGTQIRYSGVLIGTWTGNGKDTTPLEITWNGQATSATIQAVMARLFYRKTTTAPLASDRRLTFILSDSAGLESPLVTRNIQFL